MKTIWDYKVTYPYGDNVPGYDGFHSGEDRTVTDHRTDIPVTVNGVVIGIAGTTGKSTGIHLHVGKWKDGRSYNPNGRGKTLKDAVVTEIDTKGNTANGKFVRVSAEGFSWVYLHLDSVNVKVGQVLKEDDVKTNREEAIWLLRTIWHKHSPSERDKKNWTGRELTELLQAVYKADWFKDIKTKAANYDAKVAELSKAIKIKDNEIAKLKALGGDSSKWETLKALVRELVGKA